MTPHYTWESVTTLRDFGGALKRPLETFIWALPTSWSWLPARVWSGLEGFGGIIDFQCYSYCHVPSVFSFKFQPPKTIFHHKLLIGECRVLGQWMNSSIIHDNTCSLIHKKCHPKSCHSDIKYHVTLHIIRYIVYYLWAWHSRHLYKLIHHGWRNPSNNKLSIRLRGRVIPTRIHYTNLRSMILFPWLNLL
jgi:hypothetical protein